MWHELLGALRAETTLFSDRPLSRTSWHELLGALRAETTSS